MGKLINQKYLEGIDSSKFKIEQGGAIKATDSSGSLVDVFKFDPTSNVVKVFNDEEVALKSQVDAEDATFLKLDGSRPMTGDLIVSNSPNEINNRAISISSGNELESKSANYLADFAELNYFVHDVQYRGAVTLHGQQGAIQVSRSQIQDSVDQDGNIIMPAYNRSVMYSTEGIQAGFGDFEISCGKFKAEFKGAQVAEFWSEASILFTGDNTAVTDELGNEIISYCPAIVQITAEKNISIDEQSYNPTTGSLMSVGSSFIGKGYATFGKRREEDGLENIVLINDGQITAKTVSLCDVNNGVMFIPTEPQHATTKSYVDNSIIASTPVFDRARIEINTSSKLEKVVLGSDAPDQLTIIVFVNRLALHLNQDYSISNENGDYVLTWMGDFATGGEEAVELGDVVYVTYVKQK